MIVGEVEREGEEDGDRHESDPVQSFTRCCLLLAELLNHF